MAKMTAYVSNSRWGPPTTFCKSLDSQAGDLAVGTTFLPSINAPRPEGEPLVGIEASSNHLEKALLDGIEYFMGVLGGSNAKVCACWLLSVDHGGVEGEAEAEVISWEGGNICPINLHMPIPPETVVPESVILICLFSGHGICSSPLEATLFRPENRDVAQES